ncbi:ganglioside GM2 activator-like [Pecten maximus]|uniref:ganglioside GM2 activator-like n=1 Tax=Pecten maximus TaxID=6579 RepID=UPI001458A1B9|nr:ganglioside GM2 activator-like [Pecten maximus]
MYGRQLLVFLSLVSCGSCFLTHHTFSFQNCGDNNTDYIHVTNFDILPKPITVPGILNVTITGDVRKSLGNDSRLNVTIEKKLLGRWTKVPCVSSVGSCIYDNPCEFVQVFAAKGGKCPDAFVNNGIPCTCPFNPSQLSMPYSIFNISSIRDSFQWLVDGDFRFTVNVLKDTQNVGCFTTTMTMKRSDHHHSGFLFS